MKLKIHSVVDLITNSSTVIFTYSEGSLPALKELVNEMLKTFGRTEKFDDVFYAGIFLEENYHYINYVEENLPDLEISYDYLDNLKLEILKGNELKPQWMCDAEETETWNGYLPSTSLEIIPKDEKYKELANLLLNYLYSPDHEATRD